MSFDAKHLYELLPAVYRLRDADAGGPLQALLSVIAEQTSVVEGNLEQLYDDLFIETCDDWVIPYIGDLIGYRPLHGTTPQISSPRSEVANTIGYRRRKGTAYVLGLLARDVTGWPARVVEFFQLLGTTQYMKHLRPDNLRTPDLRSWQIAEDINTAFDGTSRALDVRRIASGRGRYNIPNVGIFLWRLAPYSVTRGNPRKISPQTFTFDALGFDIALFNPALETEDVAQLVQPVNIPEPLGRRTLYTELEARRQAMASSLPLPEPVYFGSHPPFLIWKGASSIPADQIQICNLSGWSLPNAVKQYRVDPLDPNSSTVGLSIQVAVDPELGRIAFPSGVDLSEISVEVDYSYGFSGDYGAGEYARAVASPVAVHASRTGHSIAAAVGALGSASGVIQVDDSATYGGAVSIPLVAGQRIIIQAEDRTRPVMDGQIQITSADEGAVVLDGLLISGGVQIMGSNNCSVTLRRCTVLSPVGTPAVLWPSTGGGELILDHTLCYALQIDDEVDVTISDSLIDTGSFNGLALGKNATDACGAVTIVRSTVIGRVNAREAGLIENSILTGRVLTERQQNGCVRFSYLPVTSQVPPRYECQPDLAIARALASAPKPLSAAQQAELIDGAVTAVQPVFTERQYDQAAWAQLHRLCPVEIRTGADDGAEMGVFHDLYQPQRESNLLARLDEYLRLGLEAGIIYEN
jgi:hypothetical protein